MMTLFLFILLAVTICLSGTIYYYRALSSPLRSVKEIQAQDLATVVAKVERVDAVCVDPLRIKRDMKDLAVTTLQRALQADPATAQQELNDALDSYLPAGSDGKETKKAIVNTMKKSTTLADLSVIFQGYNIPMWKRVVSVTCSIGGLLVALVLGFVYAMHVGQNSQAYEFLALRSALKNDIRELAQLMYSSNDYVSRARRLKGEAQEADYYAKALPAGQEKRVAEAKRDSRNAECLEAQLAAKKRLDEIKPLYARLRNRLGLNDEPSLDDLMGKLQETDWSKVRPLPSEIKERASP